MHTNLLSVSGKKEEQTSTLHLGVFQFYVFGLCLGSIVCWRYAKKKGQSTGGTPKNCSRIHSSFTFIQKLLQFSVRQATKSYYLKNKTKPHKQKPTKWEVRAFMFGVSKPSSLPEVRLLPLHGPTANWNAGWVHPCHRHTYSQRWTTAVTYSQLELPDPLPFSSWAAWKPASRRCIR